MVANGAEDVRALWDEVVADWLHGGATVPDQLKPWFGVYSGKGRGQVDPDAFPEPFLGDLTTTPAGAVLALNPGEVFPDFQYRHGHFAREIAELGRYSKWAATWPYLREREPRLPKGRGRKFHNMRWNFLKNWYRSPSLPAAKMLAFELYPWHSTGLTAPILMRSSTTRALIEQYVWRPILESGTPYIFAFGKDWFPVLKDLADEEIVTLGYGGEPSGFRVPDRTVFVGRGPNNVLIVGSKTHNVAAPPPQDEVNLLLTALLERHIIPRLPTLVT